MTTRRNFVLGAGAGDERRARREPGTVSPPRFAPGDRVLILDIGKPGHVRIPWYVRHKVGVVERHCGA